MKKKPWRNAEGKMVRYIRLVHQFCFGNVFQFLDVSTFKYSAMRNFAIAYFGGSSNSRVFICSSSVFILEHC